MHDEPYKPSFSFGHSKSKDCDEFWMLMEKLVNDAGVRCSETVVLEGFPYLRGTRTLFEAGFNLEDDRAFARWAGLMRDVDLQVRYMELDALPDEDWALLCGRAGISNCEQGRLRARTARCSALLFGDERREPSFISQLKASVARALERRYPEKTRGCFSNPETLDGILTGDELKTLSGPSHSYTGGGALEKRLNRMKSINSKTMRRY